MCNMPATAWTPNVTTHVRAYRNGFACSTIIKIIYWLPHAGYGATVVLNWISPALLKRMIHHRMAENKACCPECAGLSSSSSSVEKIFSRLMTAECRKAGNFIYPMTPCSLLKRRSSRAGIAGEGGEGEKKYKVTLAWAHTATSTPESFPPDENK